MTGITALSFWQPYAWFIVNGYADVDSRRWSPPQKRIGERIAIHASKKKVTRAEFQDFLKMVKDLKIKNHPQNPDEFDYGKIVGTVEIQGVTKSSASFFAHKGYFHWNLKKPIKIMPFKAKGRMGWFKVEIPKPLAIASE